MSAFVRQSIWPIPKRSSRFSCSRSAPRRPIGIDSNAADATALKQIRPSQTQVRPTANVYLPSLRITARCGDTECDCQSLHCHVISRADRLAVSEPLSRGNVSWWSTAVARRVGTLPVPKLMSVVLRKVSVARSPCRFFAGLAFGAETNFAQYTAGGLQVIALDFQLVLFDRAAGAAPRLQFC